MDIRHRPSVSRRSALMRLGGGGLGLALAARGLAAAAQQATPGAIPPLLAEWAAGWSAHDANRIVALYTSDGVYEEIPTNTIARGHDQIVAFIKGELAVFSDVEVRPQAGFQSDDWGVLQGIFAGRYSGQIPGLPVGKGQKFAIPFATVFQLSGGKIKHNYDYFDNYGFLIQIGALPAPGGATPRAGTPKP
jgi:steroid delta-isomerase-like uncharacterized protein